jgi:hypothetical protein
MASSYAALRFSIVACADLDCRNGPKSLFVAVTERSRVPYD